MKTLTGRAALITGSSQGLGLAIAREFVASGASVFLCARDARQLERAREEVAALAGAGQSVFARAADVSKPEEVDALAAAVLRAYPDLQILVNNAGVYGPIGPVEEVDWLAWLRAVEINLMGSVLMCRALVPHFKRRGYGKILQLSGGGATGPLPRFSAYAASKAAVARFAETLAEELREAAIDVNTIAPGALNTRLLDEVIAAGADRVGQDFYQKSLKQKNDGGAPPGKAAKLAVFLSSSASDGITGKLLAAVWDPWERLAEHRDDLRRTDVYTVRRILPEDRALTW